MKTIDWRLVSRDDSTVIRRIAKRAHSLMTRETNSGPSIIEIEMDITAAHIVCPLDLERLYSADEFNFSHDIFGIHGHLDRSTGELRDHFLPRCAK